MFFKNLFLNAAEAVDSVTEVVTAEAVVEGGFTFAPANFISNLYYMGVGMLAIFVVIAAIIGVVYALDVLVRAFSIKLPKKQ